MKQLLFGNAPCSWGMLEFDNAKAEEPIRYSQMLDELAECGYTGTELGDWGFMPVEGRILRDELQRRDLTMLGAFIPIALKDVTAHEPGIAAAVKTARLLSAVATTPDPYIVLADENGTVAERTNIAGRVPPSASLTAAEWKTFAAGADRVALAVFEETGLRTVFHHHCAGYVETYPEIAQLLELTDPKRLGLVFDTGHYSYGCGDSAPDMMTFLNQFADRIWYIHAKDCSSEVAAQARSERWDYFTALQHGLFCELGKGVVNFGDLLQWLKQRDYDGYIVVEQDVLPGMGSPRLSAQRNLDYLKSIERSTA